MFIFWTKCFHCRVTFWSMKLNKDITLHTNLSIYLIIQKNHVYVIYLCCNPYFFQTVIFIRIQRARSQYHLKLVICPAFQIIQYLWSYYGHIDSFKLKLPHNNRYLILVTFLSIQYFIIMYRTTVLILCEGILFSAIWNSYLVGV